MIIGRLRSDDIYLQTKYYPQPKHRSTALSNQAGMLYILLYFKPEILNKGYPVMREIVDKHFPDNWVISYFMGFKIDLTVSWKNFPAAFSAIKNTVQFDLCKEFAIQHTKNLSLHLKEVKNYLMPGVLTEEYALDHISKLLNCLRNCNVSLRWLMLHRTTTTQDKRIIELNKSLNPEKILLLLLNTAQFEYVLKEMFRELLDKKEPKWNQCKQKAIERMKELGEYFSGEKSLAKGSKDVQLQEWFSKDVVEKITELDFTKSTLAGRKIQSLISALEEVEEFHQISRSLQVKQFLSDTRDLLKKMIRYVNIKEQVLITIATVSDISYCWEIIEDYVKLMQKRIKEDPSLIIKIRSTFMKLATMLELPLVRISQAKSPDIVSVSQYYSSELVGFVRRVLEIIPKSMFSILNKIIQIQTNGLKEIPTKLPRNSLKEYSQLNERYDLAKSTYEVSKFTEGILAMEKTLMGVVEVDPKQLLEDGIRQQLVQQISESLHSILVFKNEGSIQDFESRLLKLKDNLQGMLRSFEYIQDYLNIYGLKIWQEEYTRIINYNVEQECNRFLKRKIFDRQSDFQSDIIPIPKYKPLDEYARSFIGRLTRELLVQTEPRKTIYVAKKSGWFDLQGSEKVGIQTFSLLNKSVGVSGLNGIDTILSHIICRLLKQFVNNTLKKDVLKNKQIMNLINSFKKSIQPPSVLHQNLVKNYSSICSKLNKIWGAFIEVSVKTGRAQLIRKHIASELNFSCKLDANPLSLSLDAMNKSLLKDIHKHMKNNNSMPYPPDHNPLLSEVSIYLSRAGMINPLEKVYITVDQPTSSSPTNTSSSSSNLPSYNIGLLLFLFLIAHLNKFSYDPNLDVFSSNKKDDLLDGHPFIIGIVTILQQFHSSERDIFLAYLGQYVKVQIDQIPEVDLKKNATSLSTTKSKDIQLPPNIRFVLHYIKTFCHFSGFKTNVLEKYLPEFVFAYDY